jgi:hypothetical protein
LKNTDWITLATYVENRNSHFATVSMAGAEDAVWNRVTNAITYTPKANGTVFITGIETRPATPADESSSDESEIYGSDAVSRLGVATGSAVTLTASPRS